MGFDLGLSNGQEQKRQERQEPQPHGRNDRAAATGHGATRAAPTKERQAAEDEAQEVLTLTTYHAGEKLNAGSKSLI